MSSNNSWTTCQSQPCLPEASTSEDSPLNVVYQMQLERFEVFKAQDEEKGHFDCTVEIGEKKLFVNKYILATASETFNSMLSNRWNHNKDEPIKIENPDYTFESFYELLCFIYSGDCNFTNENIFALTDMAEFYGITFLKNRCNEFLSNMKFNIEDIEHVVEYAEKYSLEKFSSRLMTFIDENLGAIISGGGFVNCKKAFVQRLSAVSKFGKIEENFFDAACKWAWHQASKKETESSDQDLNNLVKAELNGILANIRFPQMTLKFIQDYVLDKRFLFSAAKLYKIILNCKRKDGTEEEFFKTMYEVAENEVTEKQKTANNADFNLADAIKEEIADVLPDVRFRQMSMKFLNDFVIANGILSEEELHEILCLCVEVENDNKILTGIFEDDCGILKAMPFHGFFSNPQTWNRIRFGDKKFKLPSTPSTVSKMKGADWYLCLEKEGELTVKHQSLISKSEDYLLAEMKCTCDEFKFSTNKYACLKLSYKNDKL